MPIPLVATLKASGGFRLALAAPRLTIVLVVILSNYIGRAYETFLWPFLGFLFAPLTTLSYAWAINSAAATVFCSPRERMLRAGVFS